MWETGIVPLQGLKLTPDWLQSMCLWNHIPSKIRKNVRLYNLSIGAVPQKKTLK